NVLSPSVVAVRPRVEGEIVKLHIAEGQEVKEGDALFTLDFRAAEAARKQAEASLARDRAQLDRAKRDLERYSILLQSGSATRQKVEQLTSDVGVAEAAIKADLANIDNARLALDYAFIRAPVAGRTGVINGKLGALAKPGDTQPLVTITQLRPITVAFAVAEPNLPRIRAAMAAGPLDVSVSSASDSGLNATGRLTFVDSAIDVATGTIALKATFANDDTRLWPGQYVNVSLTLGTEAQALTVPAEAVQTGQSGQYVFAVTPQGTAELRPVAVDRILDGIAVLKSGVAAGDKVVVEGQMRLGPGVKVIEKPQAPAKS
ncbi:MAG TPA: efflux RND transporter periplasmic adaptor subunit, partial [Magnetospirillum sp.]|nr:efflux RND transporter periplasmic adaptor subunit [Magnetospirillum sp.]